MSTKKISEMSDEELLSEIERMRSVPIPQASVRRQPKRLDETKPKKKGWMDDLLEGD